MNEAEIDRLLENLFSVLPIFHKKLLRMNLGGVTGNLTRLHLGIMWMLSAASMTASELARVSVVPKPQITRLVDQLANMGIVERYADSEDRRVVHLGLTDHGRVILRELKSKVQESIRSELAGLAPEELDEMAQALETLKRVGAKLQLVA